MTYSRKCGVGTDRCLAERCACDPPSSAILVYEDGYLAGGADSVEINSDAQVEYVTTQDWTLSNRKPVTCRNDHTGSLDDGLIHRVYETCTCTLEAEPHEIFKGVVCSICGEKVVTPVEPPGTYPVIGGRRYILTLDGFRKITSGPPSYVAALSEYSLAILDQSRGTAIGLPDGALTNLHTTLSGWGRMVIESNGYDRIRVDV